MKAFFAKTAPLASLLLGLAVVPASANTITPTLQAFVPGVSASYIAALSVGELHAGDGFTIYDIYGFTSVLGTPSAFWTATTSASGSPFNVPAIPVSTGDLALTNVHFTYSGPSIQHTLGLPKTFSPFLIGTLALNLGVDDWVSKDHLVGNPMFTGDGGPAPFPATGTVSVPVAPTAVPDGGSAAALLGSVLVGFALLRRRFPRS